MAGFAGGGAGGAGRAAPGRLRGPFRSWLRPWLYPLALAAALAGCAGAGPPGGPVVPLEARFGAARSRGSAVLLPGGRLLTAAHVVDEASLREALCRRGQPLADGAPHLSGVVAKLAGRPVAATRLSLGRSSFAPQACELAYHGGADLALLRLAVPATPTAAPCEDEALPGRAVVVTTVARRLPSRIAAIAEEPVAAHGSYAVLAARLEHGESGGGVFDAASGCLLGIISQRDPRDPDRVWVVRTGVIRGFLASVAAE